MDAAPSPPHPSQPSDSTTRHSTAHLEPSPSSPKSLPKDNRNDAAKDALAGACAGAVAKTVVAPIERVKLLMQLQFSIKKPVVKGNTEAVKSSGTNIGGSGVLDGGTNCTTKGGTKSASAWQVAMRVYQEQGILAFWRGNTPNVIRQGGSAAMNFLLMDKYKTAISPLLMWTMHLPSNRAPEKRQKRRALISSFLSGGLAGGTVTTALYPIEFVRTRLAMDVGRGTADAPRLYPGGMRDVCISIWRADGWRGFYQGYGIALAGVVVYRALHLGGYDAVKTEILHSRGHRVSLGDFRIVGEKNNDILSGSNNTLTMGERFLAAQIVSITAGTACYPIDSIRRRLMMQAGVPIEVRLYKNSLDCFRKVFASEGIRGFFLGIGPNLVRSFGAALLLVSYDVFKFII